MDKALYDHTLEQLRGKATSDTVCFNALAIIEAYEAGLDPFTAPPKLDVYGEAVAHKYAPKAAPAEAPKKGRKK
jgi:hypothetical protein